MQGIFIRWLILTAAITITSYLLEGVKVSGFFSAFFTAATLGILNAFLRPFLLLLTLPINLLTLGLFTFVINAFLLEMASWMISGFQVQSFGYALIGSLVISLFNWALNTFISNQGRITHVQNHKRLEGRGE